MSEPGADMSIVNLPAMADPAFVGPGALLRIAREAQGLHIAALAVALKVPVKKLEALEADRFDLLPDIVFVRAFAMSVCRSLKVDPGPVLAGLPQLQTPPIKTDASGLNTTFKSNGGSPINARIMQLINPAGIVMLALLAAIIVVYLWPAKPPDEDAKLAARRVQPEPVPAPSQTAASIEDVAAKLLPQTITDSVKLRQTVSLNATAASALETAVFPAAAAVASLPAVTTPSPPVLSLQARGASWVEVIDAQGTAQLRKITANGEMLQVAGVLPLSVVLGRADMVLVSVRGKAFDLQAVSKDNIARFEVK